MKFTLLPALALLVGAGWAPAPAQATGCLKGAAVGAVAGHVAGHQAFWAPALAASLVIMRRRSTLKRRLSNNSRVRLGTIPPRVTEFTWRSLEIKQHQCDIASLPLFKGVSLCRMKTDKTPSPC